MDPFDAKGAKRQALGNEVVMEDCILPSREDLCPDDIGNRARVSSAEKRERIWWVDYAKTMGIVFVVFGHDQAAPLYVVKWLFSFHMPLFFALSGYLFTRTVAVGGFFSKIGYLVRSYAVFGLVGLFYFFVTQVFGRHPENVSPVSALLGQLYASGYYEGESLVRILGNAVGGVDSSIRFCVRPIPLWFFPALIVGLTGLQIVLKAPPLIRPLLPFLCFFSGCLLCDFAFPWELEAGLCSVLFLYIGAVLPALEAASKGTGALIGGVLLLALGYLVQTYNIWFDFRSLCFGNILMATASASCSIVGLFFVCTRIPWRFDWVRRVSDSTLFIFPTHILFFRFFDRVAYAAFPQVESSSIYHVGRCLACLVLLTMAAGPFCEFVGLKKRQYRVLQG